MNFYKQIDEFMVTWMPRTWRSRLFLILLIAIVCSILFAQLKGGGLLNNMGEETLIFVSIIIGLYWLFLQYKHQPFLRHFSLPEILLGSLLNLLCVVLIFAPLYFIEDLYRGEYIDSFFDVKLIFFYCVGLPMVFIPFVVRNYTFTEILLIVVAGLLSGTLIVIIANTGDISDELNFMSVIFLAVFVGLMAKVITALTQRRYGRWDKWIIFFLLAFGPFVFTFTLDYFTSSEEQSYYHSMNIVNFDLNNPSAATNYLYNFVGAFLFLLLFTWYVTRSFEKPMRVR